MDTQEVVEPSEIIIQTGSEGPEDGPSTTLISMSKERLLIQLIKEESFLYNPKHDSYRNAALKERKWCEIAQCLDWTEQQCKLKWKALRDQYSREMKRMKADGTAMIKWKYFNDLSFLRSFTLSRAYKPRSSQPFEEQPPKNLIQVKTEPSVQKDELGNWQYFELVRNDSEELTASIVEQISEQNEETQMQPALEENQDDDDDPIYTYLRLESHFERELIQLIKSEKSLYCCYHPNYRNFREKNIKWTEISNKTKKTVKQCRLKWKALRDQFCREARRLRTLENPKTAQKWKHYDALLFLEKFVKLRRDSIDTAPNTSKSGTNPSNGKKLKKVEISYQISECDEYMEEEDIENMEEYQMEEEIGEIIDSTPEEHDQTSAAHYVDEEEPHVEPDQSAVEQNVLVNIPLATGNQIITNADEVEAFFRTVSMKIQNAKMSSIAFTDLQIEILRVINGALRNY